MADSASSHDNFTGLFPDAARSMPQQQGTSAPATTCGHMLVRGVEVPYRSRVVCRWTVLRDVQATNRQRRARHAFVQPAAASRGV